MAKKKNALPKRIGGVKVPKSVRKGRLGALLSSRRGQALIAEAVLAAGALATAKKVKDSPKARATLDEAGHRIKQAGADAGAGAGAAGGALAYALGEAARSFAEAMNRHGRHDRDEGSISRAGGEDAWTPDYGAPETGGDAKKKQTSYEAGPL
jgi:hypothetical protein